MEQSWLVRELEESRRRGYLGSGPIEAQIQHSLGYVAAWETQRAEDPLRVLDLGSGGGVPGLVLATHWRSQLVLLDSMIRRTSFLEDVVRRNHLDMVTVVTGRAENLARDVTHSGGYDLVVARSFGPPSVVVECATGFLALGGLLIVSEPPHGDSESRWPASHISTLGFVSRGTFQGQHRFVVLERVFDVDARYPRRSGLPSKSPLF